MVVVKSAQKRLVITIKYDKNNKFNWIDLNSKNKVKKSWY